MQVPNVLALPLDEAIKRLEAVGAQYEVKVLLPPRDSEADFVGKEVRKYVVRQQALPDDKVVLTIVYR
ncbi:MAG: hypothetical protein IJX10_08205 [Phascolarctobacterium sp.]|nr:hypothetical protein [Phascolarctobacterium sp.]